MLRTFCVTSSLDGAQEGLLKRISHLVRVHFPPVDFERNISHFSILLLAPAVFGGVG